jgi:hypothetical protein
MKSASMTVRPRKKTDTKGVNSLEGSLNKLSTEKLDSKKISLENYINPVDLVHSPACKNTNNPSMLSQRKFSYKHSVVSKRMVQQA